MSSQIRDWSKSENQEVDVTGTAENAKAGALLMLEPERPILLRGVSEWDDETLGKRVKVKAIVRRVPGFPQADDSDEAIQGTASGGDTWVLEVKQYHVIE
jgi:hypothetical protein